MKTLFVLVAVAVLASVSLSAHHGWGGYSDADFQITGTVSTPVSTAGAHASLKITVDGQVWNVVLAPRARTLAAGLKEGIIPVGAQVTAFGHRHKDARTLEIKTERLSWNGRMFNVYPDRA